MKLYDLPDGYLSEKGLFRKVDMLKKAYEIFDAGKVDLETATAILSCSKSALENYQKEGRITLYKSGKANYTTLEQIVLFRVWSISIVDAKRRAPTFALPSNIVLPSNL